MSKEEMKRAVIAGATSALNYIERNKNATHEEVLKNVAKDMEKTIQKIGEWD